ncbi:uncharacterized protein METZ01_LOCUS141367 [marine metagenome]|uniref:Uncharacterized protein n=1 Tax=marine metagenome TaxID=408172 RepID=A0A381ZIE2_9ZZZZ
MKTSMKSIKIKDLAQISGASVQEVEMALKKNPAIKFNYRLLTVDEQREVISKIQNKLIQNDLPVSGENDPTRWEVGWKVFILLFKDNRSWLWNCRQSIRLAEPFPRSFANRLRLDQKLSTNSGYHLTKCF